ncbi:hypothetical protein [Thiothrix lacustris]|uniref:hypothetical protein n=1 Tax=Thiothrix lacustris TaxID=525917 RepID=UPI00048FCDE3|nr:hypothetical protein [Thiothrix lacustris]
MTTINTAASSTTMSEDARKALVVYLESTILGYDKLSIRKQCGTLTPRQEARLVSLENMIRSICVVCEANGLTLTDTSGYSVAMMNWSEGTKVFYGTQYGELLKDAVRFTDVASVNLYTTSLEVTVESTETLVGKIWIETKELVQLSWVFVKDSVSHVWAILRDGSKYLWGKLCDLWNWIVNIIKNNPVAVAAVATVAVVGVAVGVAIVEPTTIIHTAVNIINPIILT